MASIEYIGLVAGLLTTFALLPQILRVYKLKSAREISLLFNTSLLLGIIMWLIYGIILGRISLIVWNAIGAAFNVWLLFVKFKYGGEKVNR